LLDGRNQQLSGQSIVSVRNGHNDLVGRTPVQLGRPSSAGTSSACAALEFGLQEPASSKSLQVKRRRPARNAESLGRLITTHGCSTLRDKIEQGSPQRITE
jgi:hypothetical protein